MSVVRGGILSLLSFSWPPLVHLLELVYIPEFGAVMDDLWDGFEKLEIVSVEDVARDIKCFGLQRLHGQMFPLFKAGQFLTFKVGSDRTRNYSICSSAYSRAEVFIAVKRIDGGIGSNWFHQQQIGSKIYTRAPSGSFFHKGQRDLILIAGGIGITPILSIARTLLEKEDKRNISFFYGCRHDDDFAFDRILRLFEKKYSNFKYIPIASSASETWTGKRGRIDMARIDRLANISTSSIYLCGPPGMVSSLKENFIEMGIKDFHYERFLSPDFTDVEERELKVIFNDKEYQYKGKKKLLDFLESQGENIPYSCRAGVCGTCQCLLLEGEIEYQEEVSPDEGHLLCCVARPLTDVRIKK